jgi:hypothetical protein
MRSCAQRSDNGISGCTVLRFFSPLCSSFPAKRALWKCLNLGIHTGPDWTPTSFFCIRMIAKSHAGSGRTVYVHAAPVRGAQCLFSGTGLAGAFRLRRRILAPCGFCGCIMLVMVPAENESESKGPQLSLNSALISNGKTEVIFGNE